MVQVWFGEYNYLCLGLLSYREASIVAITVHYMEAIVIQNEGPWVLLFWRCSRTKTLFAKMPGQKLLIVVRAVQAFCSSW